LEAKKKAPLEAAGPGKSFWMRWLFTIVANGFDRAAFLGFFAKGFFFRGRGLLVNVGVTAVFVAREIGGSSFAAQIAVNALVIDVKFPTSVLGIPVSDISHK
jgi:hypothetical protein